MDDTELLYNYKRDIFWENGAGILATYTFKGCKPHDQANTSDNSEHLYGFVQSYFGHCCACGKNTLIDNKSQREILDSAVFTASGELISSGSAYLKWRKRVSTGFDKNGFVCAHCGRDYNPQHGGFLLKGHSLTRSKKSHPEFIDTVTKLTIEKKGQKIIVKSDVDRMLSDAFTTTLHVRKYYYFCFDLAKKMLYAAKPGQRVSKNVEVGRNSATYSLPKKFFTYSPFYDDQVGLCSIYNYLQEEKEQNKFFDVLIKSLGLQHLNIETDKYILPSSFCLGGKRAYEVRTLTYLYSRLTFMLNNAIFCDSASSVFGRRSVNGNYVLENWLKKLRHLFKTGKNLADIYVELGKFENLAYIVYFLKDKDRNAEMFDYIFNKNGCLTKSDINSLTKAKDNFLLLLQDKDYMHKFEKHLMNCKRYNMYRRLKMLEMVA